MKKIYLVLTTIIFLISKVFYSQDIDFTSPASGSDITGEGTQTAITVDLSYTHEKKI